MCYIQLLCKTFLQVAMQSTWPLRDGSEMFAKDVLMQNVLLETIGFANWFATPCQLKLDFLLSDSEVNIGASILVTIEADPIGWKTSPNIEY